jgi:3-deoxy-manno-octulosonate cytidylyltransferase (CMP-KDO synthetase)
VTDFKLVIPARLASTRLPRKVLRDLAGKPLLQWVWEAACAAGAREVIVATDAAEVLAACRAFGAQARLTSAAHRSGTDRVAQIAREARWSEDTIVVNLQGDEPLMPPALIHAVAQWLADDALAAIATAAHPIAARAQWLDPNVVKVVCDLRGHALYFSRAPIPWPRASGDERAPPLALRHIGLYAYRVGALERLARLPQAPLEDCELLEQLRALTHGLAIRVGVTEHDVPPGVDTEADLAAVAQHLRAQAPRR